jgi:hypothetical protein
MRQGRCRDGRSDQSEPLKEWAAATALRCRRLVPYAHSSSQSRPEQTPEPGAGAQYAGGGVHGIAPHWPLDPTPHAPLLA